MFSACAHTSAESALRHAHRTEIGLCEDYPQESRSMMTAKRDLELVRASGAKVLRIAFPWDEIEAVRGQFDWTFWDAFVREAVDVDHVRLIPYICYTPKWAAVDAGDDFWRSPPRDPEDFARFVRVIVARYRDRIASWELWNEPDNPAYWLGTPHQFAELVRAGSAAVRATQPQATVVLGGIAGEIDFLAKLLGGEHLGPAVDVVNIHSYFETWHPSPIEHVAQYVTSARNVIRAARGSQRLWMAETGYSSVGDRAEISSVYRQHFRGEHSEDAQARALARTLFEALATEELSVVAWYRINDLHDNQTVIGDDNNRHLGLRASADHRKPALATFTYVAGLFAQPYERFDVTTTSRPGAHGTPVVCAFRLADGRRVVVAWLAMPDEPAPAVPQTDDRSAEIAIAVPGKASRSVEVREAAGSRISDAFSFGARSGGTELRETLRRGEVVIAELKP